MKYRLIVRLILSVLLAALLLTAFASCKTRKPQPGPPDTQTTAKEEDPYKPPEVKYDNEEFRVYTWTGPNSDEWILESDASTSFLDSKTYSHFMQVEAETGVIFSIAQEVPGGYGRHTEFISKVAMLSGSDNIDLICQYSLAAIHGAMQGIYVNLADLGDLNWDAPYWSGDFLDSNTFNGKIYYCTGEMTRSTIYNMYLMTFNYDLVQNYALGDIYEIVENGEWTVDRLYTLSKDIYLDLNHNDSADKGDLFGLVCSDYLHIDAFQASCNLPSLIHNEMGEIEVNPEIYGQNGINVVDALRKLFHENGGAYCNTKEVPIYEAMVEGNSIFEAMYAYKVITSLNPSGINYGILPLPKYNEEQANYYTCLTMTYSIFSIPTVANNHKKSAIVMESMAHDGYIDLSPYIYESSLKSRYSKREQDRNMFDYLRKGVSYDVGRVLDNVDIFALVRGSVRDNEVITTRYEQNKSKYETELINVNFALS